MAGTHVITRFYRGEHEEMDVNGEFSTMAQDDGITVDVERFADSGEGMSIYLPFADYTGLETEWDAGTVTTVLEAAITTVLTSVTWPDPLKPSAQRLLMNSAIEIV